MNAEANVNEPPNLSRSRHKLERGSTAAFRDVRCMACRVVGSTEEN